MKKILFVFAAIGVLLVLVGISMQDSSTEAASNSEKQDSEEVRDLLTYTDGHTRKAFELLPEKTKRYMKENIELLEEFTSQNPQYMGIVDSLRLAKYEVDPNDVQLIYDKYKQHGVGFFHTDDYSFKKDFLKQINEN